MLLKGLLFLGEEKNCKNWFLMNDRFLLGFLGETFKERQMAAVSVDNRKWAIF